MSSPVAALEAALGRPPAKSIEATYTPDELPAIREELAHLEAELDTGYPGWRRKAPFAQERPELVRYIKSRLKRRDLILHGFADHGVKLTERKSEGGRLLITAVPVRPVSARSRAVVAPLGDAASAVFGTPASATVMATALGADLGDVEGAIAALTAEGKRPTRAAVKRYLSSQAVKP